MRRIILPFAITIALVAAGSCGSGEKVPEGVLDKQQMVRALTQIYIGEEKVRRLNLNTDSSQEVFDSLQVKILNRIHIQDSVLKRSFDYYMDHPLILQEIYGSLVDSLNLMEQRASVSKEK